LKDNEGTPDASPRFGFGNGKPTLTVPRFYHIRLIQEIKCKSRRRQWSSRHQKLYNNEQCIFAPLAGGEGAHGPLPKNPASASDLGSPFALSWKKKTRICAAEMAVRYAALGVCRKVHPWRYIAVDEKTLPMATITGRTDRQTDRVRRNMRPPPREESRIKILRAPMGLNNVHSHSGPGALNSYRIQWHGAYSVADCGLVRLRTQIRRIFWIGGLTADLW